MRLFGPTSATTLIVAAAGWLFTAAHAGMLPAGRYELQAASEPLTDPESLRDAALKRSAVRIPEGWSPADKALTDVPGGTGPVNCRFVNDTPGGTTPKFNCILDGGRLIRVKYGRSPEIYAEVAATRLLSMLGFAVDTVTMLPSLRCYGCPRDPFLTMHLLDLLSATSLLRSYGYDNRYTDFTWVAAETKFAARAIETSSRKGWGWWELDRSAAPRADRDAFRLLAVMLAHWDNKDENQRLVCLGNDPDCSRSLLMIQDLGSTFGPIKMNLTRWRDLPVWHDARTCTVSMKGLPFNGATFPDARISEAGRGLAARQLATLSPDQIRQVFADARFQDYYSGTDDTRDLDAWTTAFMRKVDQIVHGGPCT